MQIQQIRQRWFAEHGSEGAVVLSLAAQSAAAKCAIWSAWAFLKAGREVARST
jgi:hypothetical protein